MSDADIGPIRTSVLVYSDPERTFEFFTERIATWWPLQTHSLAEDKATGVVFSSGVGGRIYEVNPGGHELWGTVLTWEPPARVVYTWHPGRPAEQATEVEVMFEGHKDGTLVSVEHRNWHRLGAEAARLHAQYSGPDAWEGVLGLLKNAVEKEPS